MFTRLFLPDRLLGRLHGTVPFSDYCRVRRIPFAQRAGRPLPADGLARWTSALAELPHREHAEVELDLAKVNEMAGREACAHLIEAAGSGAPPPDVPFGAPAALWFLLHRPEHFHEVLFHHEDRAGVGWHTARAPAGLTVPDPERAAAALAAELRDFFAPDAGDRPAVAASAHRLTGAYCFKAQVADRLRFYQVFTDAGRVEARPSRRALPVTFAYCPETGTVMLAGPSGGDDRSGELLRRASRAILGGVAVAAGPTYDLEPLKGPFRPLPDSPDMEFVRVRALQLRYPARDGRRRLDLRTAASDGPSAVEKMLRAHVPDASRDRLRVAYAELQVRLRSWAGNRDIVVRLWPDRSNLGPTPFGDRLRDCLARWGLCAGGQGGAR